MQRKSWWRGRRGEWYVALQIVLFAVVIFGPRNLAPLPDWLAPWLRAVSYAGVFLLVVGALLLAASFLRLGANLTPLPYPKDRATLVTTGPYAFVRHPIYSGGILMAVGWALAVAGVLTLAYAVVLFVFFDVKSRREERWLAEKFADYGAYRTRVRKLIPYVY